MPLERLSVLTSAGWATARAEAVRRKISERMGQRYQNRVENPPGLLKRGMSECVSNGMRERPMPFGGNAAFRSKKLRAFSLIHCRQLLTTRIIRSTRNVSPYGFQMRLRRVPVSYPHLAGRYASLDVHPRVFDTRPH